MQPWLGPTTYFARTYKNLGIDTYIESHGTNTIENLTCIFLIFSGMAAITLVVIII
jgi:hypothetical protein